MHVSVRPPVVTLAMAVAVVATAAPACAAASLSASPSEGLSNNEIIAVTGSGFSPAAALTLVQCADPRDPDNAIAAADPVAHCNAGGAQALTATAGGHVDTDFPVSAGPFGTSGVVCNASHDCMLVLATGGDTERAEMTIKFGGGTVGPGPVIGPGPIGPAPGPFPTPPVPTTAPPAVDDAVDDDEAVDGGDPVDNPSDASPDAGPAVVPATAAGADAPRAEAAGQRTTTRRGGPARPRLAATGTADTVLLSTGLALTLAGVALLALARRPEEA